MNAPKRILLVDDDVDFVESNRDLLEAEGYEVLAAHGGEAGLELARRERPDLMVLDVMMAHDTEGFEVSRKIPQAPELRGMKVLMVTGIRHEKKLPYSFEPDATWLPVDNLLEKPVQPERLLAEIRRLLGGA